MPTFELTLLDISMVIAYVIVIVGIGFYVSQNQESTDDYFLAGRSLTWSIIGFSLFASNMSTSSLVGMAGDAYAHGIAVYNYEWMAALVLIIFAVFFLPFYLRAEVFTMPEFLERRFDARSRYYFSAVTVLGNIIIDTAGALYAGDGRGAAAASTGVVRAPAGPVAPVSPPPRPERSLTRSACRTPKTCPRLSPPPVRSRSLPVSS